jgi:hypothetical protein
MSAGRAMNPCPAALVLMLSGCAAAGGWNKPGVDPGAVAAAYADCRAMAAAAVRPEIATDEDILATRGADWQRAHIGHVEAEALHQETQGRAAAIVDSCMRTKGFARGP